MDAESGKVLDLLDSTGPADDTLVVYSRLVSQASPESVVPVGNELGSIKE
jgi:hypothetical protein